MVGDEWAQGIVVVGFCLGAQSCHRFEKAVIVVVVFCVEALVARVGHALNATEIVVGGFTGKAPLAHYSRGGAHRAA